MNHVKILFFATIRDYVGSKVLEMDLPKEMTVREFTRDLMTQYPQLQRMEKSMVVAVNHEYSGNDQILPENAEIAIFPPVSGG